MKKLFKLMTLSLLLTTQIFAADTGLSPDYLNITFYKLAVSESEYCTDLQIIIEEPQGEQFNFLSNPVLGNGSVNVGLYKCVVIEFSDNISWAPDQNSTSGNCSMGVEYSEEICQRSDDAVKLIDGTEYNCVENQEQRIALYLSTASTATGGDGSGSPFMAPTASDLNKGLNLGGALNVAQGISAKFIVDAIGRLEDRDGACRFSEPPRFSFEEVQ